MSKATIVYMVPRPFNEVCPNILPTRFNIDAPKNNDFEVLVLDGAIDRRYILNGDHAEIPIDAIQLAESLCNMYIHGQIGLGEGARPGIFFVPGEHTKESIKLNFHAELLKHKMMQIKWFTNLVRAADDVWIKFHQHNSISSLQRDAAKVLNIKRDWLIETLAESEDCPACGVRLPNPTVTKCGMCQTIIRPEEHEKKFGKQKAVA